MIRLLARIAVSLIANAVALVVTAQILDDVSLDAAGFITALVIFTGVGVLIEPLIRQVALKNTTALLGSTALIATLVSLVVTTLLSDGLEISGASTWVLATVLVWAISLVAALVLPLVIFKRVLSEQRSA